MRNLREMLMAGSERMHGRHGHGHGHGFHMRGGDGGGLGGGGGLGRGGRGGGGRVFGAGGLRLVLLALIAEQPRHGYELIKEIEQQFGGGYSPSPGSVYPTLTLLSEQGLIEAADADGAKKLFQITDEGKAYLAENAALVTSVRGRMGIAARAMAGQSAPEGIFLAMQTLKAALKFHSRGWSNEEMARVTKIIERAATDIESGANLD